MARYPNLELIEYIFRMELQDDYEDKIADMQTMKYRAEVFLQTWPNTACGFSRPGTVSGQALTDEYTTIMELTGTYKSESGEYVEAEPIYGVFFGNELGYLKYGCDSEFMKDWSIHMMKNIHDAVEAYHFCQ